MGLLKRKVRSRSIVKSNLQETKLDAFLAHVLYNDVDLVRIAVAAEVGEKDDLLLGAFLALGVFLDEIHGDNDAVQPVSLVCSA